MTTFYDYLLITLATAAIGGCTIASIIMGIASGYKHKPAHLSLPWTMLRTASIGLGIGIPANAISTLTGYYYISNMFAIRNSEEALARFAGTIALILGLNIASPVATWLICRAYLHRKSPKTGRELTSRKLSLKCQERNKC